MSELSISLSGQPGDTDSRFLLARSYHKQRRYDDALREYALVLQTDPEREALAHFCIGSLFADQGRIIDAIQSFEQSIRADPAQGEAHFRLAECYKHEGHKDKATLEFQTAKRLGFNNK